MRILSERIRRQIFGGVSFARKVEKRGVIDIETSELSKKWFAPMGEINAMFNSSILEFEERVREIGAGKLLDNKTYGNTHPTVAMRDIASLLGADKAEIDTYEPANNEAWFLSSFLALRYLASVSERPKLAQSNAISLGRLIEWWRWRNDHEKITAQTYDRKEKSKVGSGLASQGKKDRRIEAMLSEMERLALANPDSHSFGDVALASLAIKNVAESDPELWAQGKGQCDNYLSEIRTNFILRPRYLKIFPETP